MDDNYFSLFMLIFGGALLPYAAALSSGNYKLLPLRVQVSLRSKNKKGQTRHIAAVTAVTALPIVLGGFVGWLCGNTACLITMAVSAVLLIVLAVIRHKKNPRPAEPEEDEPETQEWYDYEEKDDYGHGGDDDE